MTDSNHDGQGAKDESAEGTQPQPVPVATNDTERPPAPLSADVPGHKDSDSCKSCPGDQPSASSGMAEDSASKSKDSKEPDEGAGPHEQTPLKQPEGTLNPTNLDRSINPQHHQNLMSRQPPFRGFMPMPPMPKEIPRMELAPGPRPTWYEALEHNAGLLGDHGLYRAFQSLRNPNYLGGKGPALLRAVAEYVGDADERLNSLHDSLQPNLPPIGRTGGAGSRKSVPADPFGQALMETQFYHCENGFDFLGGMIGGPSKRNTDRNSYTSNSDPPYFIRALYEWKEVGTSSRRTLDMGDIPDAKDIDVLTFMVLSRPLAAFFAKRLGLKSNTVPVLKLGMPFRSVICNYSHLRKQLELLSMKYGHSGADFQEQAKDCQPLPQQVVSTPVPSPDDNQSELFDQESALEHFRLFVQFIDRYLGEKVALFERFQAGKEESVAYEDLWMLFSNGEKIFCPLRESRITISYSTTDPVPEIDDDDDSSHLTKRRYVPQAYRVMAAVGGAPLASSLLPKAVDVSGDKLNDEPFLQLPLDRPSAFHEQATAPGLQRAKERFSALHVICMYVDLDGGKYGTDTETFVFKPFDGQVHIKSLEAYPLQYFVSPCSNYLVQRGRKFIDVTASPRYMDHAGMTIGETREECNGPVVIDLKLAFTEYQKDFPPGDSIIPKFKSLTKSWPSVKRAIPDFLVRIPMCRHGIYCHRTMCSLDRYVENQRHHLEKLQPRIQDILEEFEPLPREDGEINRLKEYMESQDLIELLPGSVPGFSLRNRAWVQLNLDQLSFIEQQDDWNKLALPKGHRQIVQAMVETHSMGSKGYSLDDSTDRLEMDLVRGKGKGCIILLHGVPGVGKTSTAECVASYTKRPLYSITCGDVGYEPEDVERNMGKHFKLANRWGCVLLLDEADVFLAKRDKTDVKRNGLVSSFLRILEYYSGILFLTTNRVGAIDDAFRSRLHLTLYYPKLTQTQTLKIWRTNLQRLKENNKIRLDESRVPIKFNDKKIIDWIKKNWRKIQWNGRQIRNAFQTAVALAEFKAKNLNEERDDMSPKTSPRLTVDHFKLLARASTQFSEYLRETHGDDEDERAMLDKTRAVPTRRKTQKTVISDEDEEEDEDEDEDDDNLQSESGSGSESSGDSRSGDSHDSGTDSSAVEEKSRKKGKQKDTGRSRPSKKSQKGKRREDR